MSDSNDTYGFSMLWCICGNNMLLFKKFDVFHCCRNRESFITLNHLDLERITLNNRVWNFLSIGIAIRSVKVHISMTFIIYLFILEVIDLFFIYSYYCTKIIIYHKHKYHKMFVSYILKKSIICIRSKATWFFLYNQRICL